jgi:RNA recognition motif-containing protein
VGDLSIYCTKEELESVFCVFGPIRDIRIKCDELTGKNLSYGFIEFESVTSAVNVLTRMNGYVLCGRPMRLDFKILFSLFLLTNFYSPFHRVRWAANKSKKVNEGTTVVNAVKSNETSPVHVTYTTLQVCIFDPLLKCSTDDHHFIELAQYNRHRRIIAVDIQ